MVTLRVVDAIEGAEAVAAKIRQLPGYCGEVHFAYGAGVLVL